MEKKRSRRSWKKELDHEVGEELKEKGWESMVMEKKKSRRSLMKELDHEVGEELKEKDGSS